jgi:hypothetical protein
MNAQSISYQHTSLVPSSQTAGVSLMNSLQWKNALNYFDQMHLVESNILQTLLTIKVFTWFTISEEFDFSQCRKMNPHRDVSSHFQRQKFQNFVLVKTFLG